MNDGTINIKELVVNNKSIVYLNIGNTPEKEIISFYKDIHLDMLYDDYKELSELFMLQKYKEGYAIADKLKNKYRCSASVLFKAVVRKFNSDSYDYNTVLLATKHYSTVIMVGTPDKFECFIPLPEGICDVVLRDIDVMEWRP